MSCGVFPIVANPICFSNFDRRKTNRLLLELTVEGASNVSHFVLLVTSPNIAIFKLVRISDISCLR